MLFVYDKNTKEISSFEETDFKSQNISERQDIENWIEENPDILGEQLLILSKEYDKFDKTKERLDLLAIDKLGNLIIIELKRDDSGKSVDLQALKYAAYCSTLTFNETVSLYQNYLESKGQKKNLDEVKDLITNFIDNNEFEEIDDRPRIMLVSREFRQEVTASVIWLRKFGIDISCIKLTPYQINESMIAFSSNILIPLPEAGDFIIRSEEKDNKKKTLTLSQEEYLKFYTELAMKMKNKLPVSLSTPLPQAYYKIPTGISGFHFEWGFHGRPRSSFGVELHFEKGNKEYNQSACEKLERLKSKIESKTGESVIFQKDWGKRWSRIYLEKNEGKMTKELKDWAIEKMKLFNDILQPELEKLY